MSALSSGERGVRAIAIGACLALALVIGGAFVVGLSRELLYPWADDAEHVGLQLASESACPVALGYRLPTDSEWRWPTESEPHSGRPTRFAAADAPIQIIEPVLQPQHLALRLECAPQSWSPPIEVSLDVQPRAHVRVHISENGEVSVAQGVETFIGFAIFGPEHGVGSITP